MIFPAGLPLFAYVAGSLLGWHCADWRDLFGVGLLCCVPPALALFLGSRRLLWKLLPLLMCLVLLAALRTSLRLKPVFSPDHLVHHASGQPLLLEGVLVRQPEVRTAFTRLVFEARTLRTSGGAVGTQGRADLWVSGRMPDLRVGDILLAEVRLKIPRRFGNPGEVDRKARSFLEGTYVRGSVRDGRHLFRLGVAEGYRFERFVQEVRSDLAAFFEKEPDPKARGLLRAWFLGDRSGLTDALAEAFRSSGLAHLLAISGLHVGLVGLFTYRVLKWLLKRSDRVLLRFSVEKIAVLGCLPVVLAYVLLVGAPMTAVRAVTMFALFVGSLLLDRARAVWNSLSCSRLVDPPVGPGCLVLRFVPAFLHGSCGFVGGRDRLETYSPGGAFSRARDTGMVLEPCEGPGIEAFHRNPCRHHRDSPAYSLHLQPNHAAGRFRKPGRRARGWLARDSLRPRHGGDGPGLATGSRSPAPGNECRHEMRCRRRGDVRTDSFCKLAGRDAVAPGDGDVLSRLFRLVWSRDIAVAKADCVGESDRFRFFRYFEHPPKPIRSPSCDHLPCRGAGGQHAGRVSRGQTDDRGWRTCKEGLPGRRQEHRLALSGPTSYLPASTTW